MVNVELLTSEKDSIPPGPLSLERERGCGGARNGRGPGRVRCVQGLGSPDDPEICEGIRTFIPRTRVTYFKATQNLLPSFDQLEESAMSLPLEFFEKFNIIDKALELKLRQMTKDLGSGPQVQKEKIRMLMGAGLSWADARDYLYAVMFEPDEKGESMLF
jgi:hypothetical protein